MAYALLLPSLLLVIGLALAWLFCQVWTRLFPNGMNVSETGDQYIMSYMLMIVSAAWLSYEMHHALTESVRWIGVYASFVLFLCSFFVMSQLRLIVKGEIDEQSIC